MTQYLRPALTTLQQPLAMIAQDAITRYGQQYGQRNPRRAPSLNQYVGQQLQPFMRRTGGL